VSSIDRRLHSGVQCLPVGAIRRQQAHLICGRTAAAALAAIYSFTRRRVIVT